MELLTFLLLWVLLQLQISQGGHEILYRRKLEKDDIRPLELAVIQFDSRMPIDDYWKISAYWNRAYCRKWGHQYLFLSIEGDCFYGKLRLSSVWCKVKAMLDSNALLPKAKAILYIDSDAFISVNYSMTDALSYMKKDLHWDTSTKPVALNQDGPGWSCKNAMKLGFPVCLNSGTVFWVKGETSLKILQTWWDLAAEPYDRSKFTSKWREVWPWEQAQLYKVHDAYMSRIMLLSFPDKPFLPWTSKKNPKAQYPTDYVEPWCFSHWPGANCFITHGAASLNQKRKLMNTYAYLLQENSSKANHEPLVVTYIPKCV